MKRTLKKVASGLALAIALTAGAGAAHAGPALDVVKSKQAALFEVIKQPSTGETRKRIDQMFDEMLDYNALAKASLGAEWDARSDAEKAEFTSTLKGLVRKAYEKNLKKTVDFDIDYAGEENKDAGVLVKTKAKSKADAKDEPIEISYLMVQDNGSWKVGDIVTEGVSLVVSWRGQFLKIVRKDGFPALIKKMKDKLARGDV